MREHTWKKAAMAAMKQHGFKKNAINHIFYCEWPHCLAAAVFEAKNETQTMRIRLDLYVYARHDLMNLMDKVDYRAYVTCRGEVDFPLDGVTREAVYDQVTAALQESVPRISNLPD